MARNAKTHLPPNSLFPETEEVAPTSLSSKQQTRYEFGRRLLNLCLQKGWNQSDLARASELGRDAISTYVRGRSFPDPKNLRKLADALGVAMDDLLPNT
ncbi:MAG: helix-turn-helix domain-containing protein, partial [Nevskiales bacterium]